MSAPLPTARTAGPRTPGPAWWQTDPIYQIYPRSFADSDGDGVGDLAGIRSRLDYLASLGIAAIWLSPIYPSPMVDFGYDVSDYCDVDPTYGTLADFDALLADAHARGIRVVLDWVPNHTSDRHPWFVDSRSSRSSAKRDWYVWRDPAPDGGPPNDWQSIFSAVGPAWTFEPGTGQYYLHSFAREQPDLNWDNPEVEAAMHDTLRFWLDRGVDGLRLDAILKIGKDPALRSNAGGALRHEEDWPTVHDRLRRIRDVLELYPDRMAVAELWTKDLRRFVSFLNDGEQLHMAHNFEFVDLPWAAGAYEEHLRRFADSTTPLAWPCWFLENHDLPRVATRFDEPGVDGAALGPARARAILVMLATLRGTPFIFEGQELGLPNAVVPPERVVDVDGRDPGRAPVPWARPSEVGPGAGFTTGEPWLPIVDDAERLCVQAQESDPASTLALTRQVFALRHATPALKTGDQRLVDVGEDVLAWLREGDDGDTWLVVVSFGTGPVSLAIPRDVPSRGVVVLSSDVAWPGPATPARDILELDSLILAAGEALLIRLEPVA
jgi:alpha-glucosidase